MSSPESQDPPDRESPAFALPGWVDEAIAKSRSAPPETGGLTSEAGGAESETKAGLPWIEDLPEPRDPRSAGDRESRPQGRAAEPLSTEPSPTDPLTGEPRSADPLDRESGRSRSQAPRQSVFPFVVGAILLAIAAAAVAITMWMGARP